MTASLLFLKWPEVSLLFLACASMLHAQSFLSDIQSEHDPAKRSVKALVFADTAFDTAKDFYNKGDVEKGDAQLDDMTHALQECVVSLQGIHKPQSYKKAEMKVAYLQRRLQGLMDDIDTQRRGWAEFTQRKLDEIHDKLLAGVMRK